MLKAAEPSVRGPQIGSDDSSSPRRSLLRPGAYWGASVCLLKLCGVKTDFPSAVHMDHTRHTFLCKHGKHANTYTSVYLWKIPVSFWPRSTLDSATEAPDYINGAFLSCGGKPHTHCVMRTHSQGNPLTYSHAPALCKCQTVGERVYLGAPRYFYTFVTASLVHTHTPTQIGSSNTSHPVNDKPWPWCTASLRVTQNT